MLRVNVAFAARDVVQLRLIAREIEGKQTQQLSPRPTDPQPIDRVAALLRQPMAFAKEQVGSRTFSVLHEHFDHVTDTVILGKLKEEYLGGRLEKQYQDYLKMYINVSDATSIVRTRVDDGTTGSAQRQMMAAVLLQRVASGGIEPLLFGVEDRR